MKKTDIKIVAMTAVGVMLAGVIMNALSDVGIVQDARMGLGGR